MKSIVHINYPEPAADIDQDLDGDEFELLPSEEIGDVLRGVFCAISTRPNRRLG
ncbi:hypothetical protein [Rhizobium sp. BR 315]|uniref:hypothetical protein n=1 Tax=Rhizobium sp. BR 315 TaxID=3040014 RepID=UPI003D33FAC1